ncbi:Mu-like prophage major head subunit gpT family protein, partial [Vibrio scophthalmi]
FEYLPTTIREPWFLLDTSKPLRALIFQPRRPFKFTQLNDPNQAFVFLNNEYAMGVDGRSNAGYGMWQFAFASQLELNEENFTKARSQMRKITKANGTPLGVRPTTIVVGPDNESAATTLFDAITGPNGSSNTLYKKVEIIVSEYITKPGE